MIHIAVRVQELVSSNLETLVSKTTDPAKVLNLLRSEIEETLISFHSELTMTKRQHERGASYADKLAADAELWTAKAKTAIDHKREDLARAALLAREGEIEKAAEARLEVEELARRVSELENGIADLDAKREDVIARAAASATDTLTIKTVNPSRREDNNVVRRMDRIDAMERRASFQNRSPAETQGDAIANADAEIAALSQASMIDAELNEMKAQAKKPARKKAK